MTSTTMRAIEEALALYEPPAAFDRAVLARVQRGEILLSQPERYKSFCARFVRAYVNTLAGETFFTAETGDELTPADKLPGLRANKWGVYGSAWEYAKNISEHGGNAAYIRGCASLSAARVGDIIGFFFQRSEYRNFVGENGATHLSLVVDRQNGSPLLAQAFSGRGRHHDIVSYNTLEEMLALRFAQDGSTLAGQPMLIPRQLLRPDYTR